MLRTFLEAVTPVNEKENLHASEAEKGGCGMHDAEAIFSADIRRSLFIILIKGELPLGNEEIKKPLVKDF